MKTKRVYTVHWTMKCSGEERSDQYDDLDRAKDRLYALLINPHVSGVGIRWADVPAGDEWNVWLPQQTTPRVVKVPEGTRIPDESALAALGHVLGFGIGIRVEKLV